MATEAKLTIPAPRSDDGEDVAFALTTASTLWDRGDGEEAVRWLRRAVESASDADQDERALELGKLVAEIAAAPRSASRSAPASAAPSETASPAVGAPPRPSAPARPPSLPSMAAVPMPPPVPAAAASTPPGAPPLPALSKSLPPPMPTARATGSTRSVARGNTKPPVGKKAPGTAGRSATRGNTKPPLRGEAPATARASVPPAVAPATPPRVSVTAPRPSIPPPRPSLPPAPAARTPSMQPPPPPPQPQIEALTPPGLASDGRTEVFSQQRIQAALSSVRTAGSNTPVLAAVRVFVQRIDGAVHVLPVIPGSDAPAGAIEAILVPTSAGTDLRAIFEH